MNEHSTNPNLDNPELALIADFLLLPPLLMKLEEKDFAKDMVTDTA